MKVLEPLRIQSSPSGTALALQRSKIRTARRLGHGEGGDQFPGTELGQPALFLLLCAEVNEVWRDAVGVDAHT